MDIDVKALDKSLQRIPLHVRLQVPHHSGSHIDNKYGASTNYRNREKTLAEIREESKWCIATVFDDGGGGSSNDATAVCNHNESNVKVNDGDNDYVDNGDKIDDDDEDLEAWLDDIISNYCLIIETGRKR